CASGVGLEGGRGVLEELLLPAVEHRGADAVLVPEVGERDVLEEMEPQDGALLVGREPLSGPPGHGSTSPRRWRYFETTVAPISTGARHRSGRSLPGDARDQLDDDASVRVPDVVERPPARLALRPLARGDRLHPQPTVLLELRAGVRDAEGDV